MSLNPHLLGLFQWDQKPNLSLSDLDSDDGQSQLGTDESAIDTSASASQETIGTGISDTTEGIIEMKMNSPSESISTTDAGSPLVNSSTIATVTNSNKSKKSNTRNRKRARQEHNGNGGDDSRLDDDIDEVSDDDEDYEPGAPKGKSKTMTTSRKKLTTTHDTSTKSKGRVGNKAPPRRTAPGSRNLKKAKTNGQRDKADRDEQTLQ